MEAKAYLPHEIRTLKLERTVQNVPLGVRKKGTALVEVTDGRLSLDIIGEDDYDFPRETNKPTNQIVRGEAELDFGFNHLAGDNGLYMVKLCFGSKGSPCPSWQSVYRFSKQLPDSVKKCLGLNVYGGVAIRGPIHSLWRGNNLRDIIPTERSTREISKMEGLLESPFEMDPEDAPHFIKLGLDRTGEERFPFYRSLFLAFCYHELRHKGVDEEFLRRFKEIAADRQESWQTYERLRKDLDGHPQAKRILNTMKDSYYYLDDLFSVSMPNENYEKLRVLGYIDPVRKVERGTKIQGIDGCELIQVHRHYFAAPNVTAIANIGRDLGMSW